MSDKKQGAKNTEQGEKNTKQGARNKQNNGARVEMQGGASMNSSTAAIERRGTWHGHGSCIGRRAKEANKQTSKRAHDSQTQTQTQFEIESSRVYIQEGQRN